MQEEINSYDRLPLHPQTKGDFMTKIMPSNTEFETELLEEFEKCPKLAQIIVHNWIYQDDFFYSEKNRQVFQRFKGVRDFEDKFRKWLEMAYDRLSIFHFQKEIDKKMVERE